MHIYHIHIYIIHYIPIGQSQTRICPTWSSNIFYISNSTGLEITSDSEWYMWNTSSWGWTPFCTGGHDRFYFFHNVFFSCNKLTKHRKSLSNRRKSRSTVENHSWVWKKWLSDSIVHWCNISWVWSQDSAGPFVCLTWGDLDKSVRRTGSLNDMCRQVSNIRRTLVSNKIVDHSDVVGASPVGAAPTTSSFST